jgi:lipopolysaccharide transport system permease protein
MLYYGVAPGWGIVTLPFFVLLALAAALAVGLWLSALNVQYRDFRYTIPFLTQFWFFATPVVYPSSLIPERWRLLFGLNPMAGVVEGFRWALLGKAESPGPMLWVSVASVTVLLVGGLFYFRRMERSFADIV